MQIPIESLNLLMLNVGVGLHDGDWNWKDVSSPFTRIYCVTHGQACLHLPGGVQELSPGHLYIIPAYTRHSYECDGVFCHYYLHVYEEFKNETHVFDTYNFPTEVEADESCRQLFEAMCQAHPEARLPESDPRSYDNTLKFTDYVRRYNSMALWEKMRLRGVILLLFSRFMERATPKVWTQDRRIARVLAEIHERLYDDIDIGQLADVACVTKPYLIRVFKRELGLSPLQYVNQKKVERAQLLLLTNDMPVKEVAYTLGFSDHSYFIRLFRKMTGTTPLEYRRNVRGEK